MTSPLARAKETASFLERLTESHARVEPGVGEIPSPGLGLAERGAWLRDLFAGTWEQGGPNVVAWRDAVAATLLRQPKDAAIFSHFVAINVAVGAATGDDRVMAFRPDYCSVTIVETDGERLRLVEMGAEAATIVR